MWPADHPSDSIPRYCHQHCRLVGVWGNLGRFTKSHLPDGWQYAIAANLRYVGNQVPNTPVSVDKQDMVYATRSLHLWCSVAILITNRITAHFCWITLLGRNPLLRLYILFFVVQLWFLRNPSRDHIVRWYLPDLLSDPGVPDDTSVLHLDPDES